MKRLSRKYIAVGMGLALTMSLCVNAPLVGAADTDSPELKMVIQSGFEDGVTITRNDSSKQITLSGIDSSCSAPNNWSNLLFDGTRNQMVQSLYYRTPTDSDYQITEDPTNPQNKVAKFQVMGINPPNDNNGRAQIAFMNAPRYGHTEYYDVVHTTFRQYISNDWKALANIPTLTQNGQYWTDFFEMWDQVPTANDFSNGPKPNDAYSINGAGAFRLQYEFIATGNPNVNGGFKWHMQGDDMSFYSTDTDKYKSWSVENTDVPVPFGRWTEWDVYVVKGPDPKTNTGSPARVIVKMRPEGEDWVTLFDVSNQRTQHSWMQLNGYFQISPFKNYCGPETMNYLNSQNATNLSMYFDDFALWVGKK